MPCCLVSLFVNCQMILRCSCLFDAGAYSIALNRRLYKVADPYGIIAPPTSVCGKWLAMVAEGTAIVLWRLAGRESYRFGHVEANVLAVALAPTTLAAYSGEGNLVLYSVPMLRVLAETRTEPPKIDPEEGPQTVLGSL